MDKALFKNTQVSIKDGYLYIKTKLDVVLDEDTKKMRGNGKNDAIAIANAYQVDINDYLHLNFQLNTNTKANKQAFKDAKKAKKQAITPKKTTKKAVPKTNTLKPKIVKINGLVLDLNDQWDSRKYENIKARA